MLGVPKYWDSFFANIRIYYINLNEIVSFDQLVLFVSFIYCNSITRSWAKTFLPHQAKRDGCPSDNLLNCQFGSWFSHKEIYCATVMVHVHAVQESDAVCIWMILYQIHCLTSVFPWYIILFHCSWGKNSLPLQELSGHYLWFNTDKLLISKSPFLCKVKSDTECNQTRQRMFKKW